jgi:hypothetical protein
MITAVSPLAARERPVSSPPPKLRVLPPVPRQPARPHRLSPRPHRPSPGPHRPSPGLRLTRRGRVVAASMAALLVTMVLGIAAGAAQATSHGPSSRTVERSLVQVTVRPGQSLWSVAEVADPNADTRVVIQQIVELNALSGTIVFAGERLWVPRE